MVQFCVLALIKKHCHSKIDIGLLKFSMPHTTMDVFVCETSFLKKLGKKGYIHFFLVFFRNEVSHAKTSRLVHRITPLFKNGGSKPPRLASLNMRSYDGHFPVESATHSYW